MCCIGNYKKYAASAELQWTVNNNKTKYRMMELDECKGRAKMKIKKENG